MSAIVDQVRRAAQKQNRTAAIIGAALGAFVPVSTYYAAHFEAGLDTWRARGALGLVLAGLVFSAISVLGWARAAFASLPKAVAFSALLEGSMTLSGSAWVAGFALAILVTINALSTACNIADDAKEQRKAERESAKPPAMLDVTAEVVDAALALSGASPGNYVTVTTTRSEPVRKPAAKAKPAAKPKAKPATKRAQPQAVPA